MADPKITMRPPVVLPSGPTVWTDEFDPSGEELTAAQIRLRRQRRAAQRQQGELGLDLAAPPPPPPPPMQTERRDRGASSFPQPENLDTVAALIQTLRSGHRAG